MALLFDMPPTKRGKLPVSSIPIPVKEPQLIMVYVVDGLYLVHGSWNNACLFVVEESFSRSFPQIRSRGSSILDGEKSQALEDTISA